MCAGRHIGGVAECKPGAFIHLCPYFCPFVYPHRCPYVCADSRYLFGMYTWYIYLSGAFIFVWNRHLPKCVCVCVRVCLCARVVCVPVRTGFTADCLHAPSSSARAYEVCICFDFVFLYCAIFKRARTRYACMVMCFVHARVCVYEYGACCVSVCMVCV